jgi:predicted nucleic acid-binding protein
VKTYFDTSLLLKCYIQEPGTENALAILKKSETPFPFSHILEIELRTAIRLKHGRGEITAAQMRGVLQSVESDIAAGVLSRPAYHLEQVYRRAEAVSRKHAVATLARTGDILHVASALETDCRAFGSFDERQRMLASLCGLELVPARQNGAQRRTKKPNP